MSVSSTTYSISYTSDGSTAAWAIPYYFMAFTDLVVQVNTAGVVTTAVYTTQYTVSGTPNMYGAYPSGGTLTWTGGNIPAAGAVFTIIRMTARLQPDQYINNSAFPAQVSEADLDRLTLISQEASQGLAGFIGILAGPPTAGTWTAGQWFILTPFAALGYFGYVCTVSGSPGTWLGFGTIA